MKPFHYALLFILMSGAMATSYAQETTEIIFHKSHEPKNKTPLLVMWYRLAICTFWLVR